MKSVFELSGTRRAAALLIALGPEIAADIMKHLDEDSIEKLIGEMAGIEKLTPYEREDLIGEFILDLRKTVNMPAGGESKARSILDQAFGPDKAEEIIAKVMVPDPKKEFAFFHEVDPDILYNILKDEHPQSIAVTMAHLKPRQSGHILKNLSPAVSKDVALRMARMQQVSQEAVVAVARKIKEKYKAHLEKNGIAQTGGVDTLIEIMNHMKGEDEKKLLDRLETDLPDVSRGIRDRIFIFENITNLTNVEVRVLIEEVQDDQCVATALKGAGDEIRFKILRNMSQNRASDIIREMDAMGPVRLSEVEDCRNRIVDSLRRLHHRGDIVLRKGNEIFVE